jgi:hypothetical protein
MTWPKRADCVRPGCGHSSDVHMYPGPVGPALSLTDAAAMWPCAQCECVTMIRSPENYAALIAGPGGLGE